MNQFDKTSVQRQSVVTTTNSGIPMVCTRLYDITSHKGLQCLDCSAHQRLGLQMDFCLFPFKAMKSSLLPFTGGSERCIEMYQLDLSLF